MTRTSILLGGLILCAVATQAAWAQDPLESQFTLRREKSGAQAPGEAKANEIVKGNVVYSGIAVEAIKNRNWLQLINPLAPAKYGSAEDNTIVDPASGKPRAWKLFSIRF